MERDEHQEPMSEPSENPNCALVDGCHVWKEYNANGEFKIVPLSNFNARIESEEIRDDGQDQKTTFTITGEMDDGTPLPTVKVSSILFATLNWIIAMWGSRVIIETGMKTRDRLRYAIQVASRGCKSVTVHVNLGWKYIGRAWFFLTANGAIGANGFRDDIIVDPDEGGLHDFRLPTPPQGKELTQAIRASLALVKLGPKHILYPLLAATYRAPLNESLPSDYSLSLVGPTGVFKTSVAAIFQSHCGLGFKDRRLAGSWSSTANSNERRAYLAKDNLTGFDDFVPEVNSDLEADRLLRAQGNAQGRGRMRSDGTLRPANYPRGIILSTGEQNFKGQSLRSRMLILELSKGDILEEELTSAQAIHAEGAYAKSMSGYIQWLAPKIDELRANLPKRQRELRNECSDANVHKRTPDITAHLGVGLEKFIQFARESQAITDEEFKQYWNEGWTALKLAGEMQSGHQNSEDPCTQFIELLASAFVSGAAHLAHPYSSNGMPNEYTRWGWREDGRSTPTPKGERIGWLNGSEVWLQPDVAYAVAQKIAVSQKTLIPISKDTLWKRLAEQKIISISQGEGKNLVKKTVLGGGRPRVVVFPNKDIFGGAPVAPEAPVPLGLVVGAADAGKDVRHE
jgi:hypothetical protein